MKTTNVLQSPFIFRITGSHAHTGFPVLTCLFRSSIILVICIFFLPISCLTLTSCCVQMGCQHLGDRGDPPLATRLPWLGYGDWAAGGVEGS